MIYTDGVGTIANVREDTNTKVNPHEKDYVRLTDWTEPKAEITIPKQK